MTADIGEPCDEHCEHDVHSWPESSPCCTRAVYEYGIGWWCPEHGDQP